MTKSKILILTFFLLTLLAQTVSAKPCSDFGLQDCSILESAEEKCDGQKVYACDWITGALQYCWRLSKTCPVNYKCNLNDSDFCSCDSTDTYEFMCYSGDLYYFNKCSEIKAKKQDCLSSGYTGSNYCYNGNVYKDYIDAGCHNSACYANTTRKLQDSCESYEKCESGACKQKTCLELGYVNSCTGLDPTKCISGHPYECKSFGSVKCYVQTDTCTSGEKCVDPLGLTGAHCECDPKNYTFTYKCDFGSVYYFDECGIKRSLIESCGASGYTTANYCSDQSVYRDYTTKGCTGNACYSTTEKRLQATCKNYQYCSNGSCLNGSITSATWGKSSAFVFDAITLTATVSGIQEGTKIRFEVMEDDPFSGNLLDTLYANVSSGKAQVNWIVKYTQDWWGKPEMSFKAMVDAQTSISKTSSEIIVSCTNLKTGNKRCNYDTLEEEWTDSQCKLVWKALQNCNSADKTTDWNYSCTANALVKKRAITDGYCDSAAKACKTSTRTESSTVQCSATQACDATQKACLNWALSSAIWSKSYAYVGDNLTLTVSSLNIPEGKKIRFEIWENDAFFNDKVATLYSNINLGKATVSWAVPVIKDGVAKPEIFFKAMVDEQPSVSANSAEIIVSCLNKATGKKRCSGNILEAEWLSSTCTLSWKQNTNCDSLDNTPAWAYSCISGNILYKTRTITDGYCNAASPSCLTRSFADPAEPKTQCSATEICNAAQKACVPCAISSAYWSKTIANQWDTVQMKAYVPSCEGKEIVFDIMENDGAFPHDFVQTARATVSGGYAVASWNASYVEDQWGKPEFYFNAKIGTQSKKSSNLTVNPIKTNTDLSGLVNTVKNSGPFTIITFASPTGEALNQINQLKAIVETMSGKPAKMISHKQISGCWDYANLGQSLILIGYYSDNNAINCLKTDNYIEGRGLNYAQDQISIVSNPWAYGKYAIIVQGANNYYDSIVGLRLILKGGSSKLLSLKDSVIGCLWTGDMSTSTAIACNIIPVVELIPDARDTFNCVKNHPLTALPVPVSSYSNESLIDEIICKVTYAAAAYDIAGYVGAVFTLGFAEVGAEVGDTTFAAFKVTLKSALQGLERKVIEDAWATFKLIPDSGKMLFKIAKDFPKQTVEGYKALIRMLASGKGIATKGMKFLGDNPNVYSAIDYYKPEIAVEATTSLFKMEPAGTKIVIETTNKVDVVRFGIGDQLNLKIKNTQSALQLPQANIKEIQFVDNLPGAFGALDRSTNQMFLKMQAPAAFTKDAYFGQLLHNTIPHEITHTKFPLRLHFTKASEATEDYLVDMTLRGKISGTGLDLYKAAESDFLKKYDYSSAFNTAKTSADTEKAVMADLGQKYAEFGDYGLTTTKTSFEYKFKTYIGEKYPGATTAFRTQKLNEFKAFSDSLKNAANQYAAQGVWTQVPDFVA